MRKVAGDNSYLVNGGLIVMDWERLEGYKMLSCATKRMREWGQDLRI